MKIVPLFCFSIMTIAINCAFVPAEPSELESVKKTLGLLERRVTFDSLNLRRNIETERRLRIELQSAFHQLQGQMSANSYTIGPDEMDIARAHVMSKQGVIEQLRKEVHKTLYLNRILRNDNNRLQNVNNDLRHDIIVLQKAYGEETQSRKRMEKIVNDLMSKQEELQLEIGKASDQGKKLNMFKSCAEKSLTNLRSDLHHIEQKQNVLNSSTSTVIHKMDAYIDSVSNEVCKLNPSFVDDCPSHGIPKSICCFKGALQSVQESLQENFLKLSEFKQECHCRASFSARVSPSIQDINPYDTIVFSDVLHNEGNAYNLTSGKFIAPVGGTYVFFSHILGGPRSLETALMINDDMKLVLYSGDPKYLAPGSNMLVTRMHKGDSARMIKYGPWGERPFYIHHTWSTFSGFLLSYG